ncbi:MAG: PPOX class F420-dependent oxidoreductase [SAR324 cluster bacterium]
MSTPIPAAAAALFTGKALANLATVGPTGQPLVTPVWVDRDGDKILINSAKGRVKNRNMVKGAKVALSIVDPANPYRYFSAQGVVVKVTTQGADEHIDKLSLRYLGMAKYPNRQPGEVRELFVIEPTRVKLQG